MPAANRLSFGQQEWRRSMARNRRNRLLVNGRNATSTAFVMLDNYVFDCPAYRAIAPAPRCLLWELVRRHNGSNNGKIGLGVREAAKCLNVTKDTAAGYFRVLLESGFIAPNRPGGFNLKDPSTRRATEWRLTWIRCNDQPPTKEFIDHSRKSTVPKIGTPSPNNLDTDGETGPGCPDNLDLSQQSQPAIGPNNLDTYISGHGQGDCVAILGWWQPDWTPLTASAAFAAHLAHAAQSHSSTMRAAA